MASIEDLIGDGAVITRVKKVQPNAKLHDEVKNLSKSQKIVYWIAEYAIEIGQKDLIRGNRNVEIIIQLFTKIAQTT